MAKDTEKKEVDRMDAVTTEKVIKSQAAYKGNTQLDRVTVTVEKNGKHVKEGKKYSIHPTTALIWQEKGLISKGWENSVNKYTASESGTSLQDKQVTKQL